MEEDNFISVFEHDTLSAGNEKGDLSDPQLAALRRFYGTKGVPYYTLINEGVKFCEYVGVIRVGGLTIEILPKAVRRSGKRNDVKTWQQILLGMLKSVGAFRIHAPSSSQLELRANSILELYIELFLVEAEYILNRGPVKKYHQKEGNRNALKGQLLFGKNLNHNLLHQERFYVRYTAYDQEHRLNAIIYKALGLLRRINRNPRLHGRIGSILLRFPEQKDFKVSEALFKGIVYDRKTTGYRHAIEFARLLLLNYHPDVTQGQEDVLALMFDMNLLWEKFIYASLLKDMEDSVDIAAQSFKSFWIPQKGQGVGMQPDIVVSRGERTMVLDTKWKDLKGSNPTSDDLRQLYVYHDYFNAAKAALVYPGSFAPVEGFYATGSGVKGIKECGVIGIEVMDDIVAWQGAIKVQLMNWLGEVPVSTIEIYGNNE